MSKKCSQCDRTFNNNDFEYCPYCSGRLYHQEERHSTYTESDNNSSFEPPYGYVYDFGGHLRPDPEILRQEKERIEESFRNRW